MVACVVLSAFVPYVIATRDGAHFALPLRLLSLHPFIHAIVLFVIFAVGAASMEKHIQRASAAEAPSPPWLLGSAALLGAAELLFWTMTHEGVGAEIDPYPNFRGQFASWLLVINLTFYGGALATWRYIIAMEKRDASRRSVV